MHAHTHPCTYIHTQVLIAMCGSLTLACSLCIPHTLIFTTHLVINLHVHLTVTQYYTYPCIPSCTHSPTYSHTSIFTLTHSDIHTHHYSHIHPVTHSYLLSNAHSPFMYTESHSLINVSYLMHLQTHSYRYIQTFII